MNKNHIIFSYSFNNDGNASKVEISDASRELKSPDFTWVHLDGNNKSTEKWLHSEVNYLDEIIIDALITEEVRPRIVKFEKGILLIFRGINQTKNSQRSEMVSLRMWIDDRRFISVQRRPMKSLFEMEHSIGSSALKVTNSGEFLHNFIDLTLQNINDYVYSIGGFIDNIEHKVLSTRDLKYRQKLSFIRSQLTVSRRYLSPLREVIFNLKNCQYEWINENSLRYFQENYDQITHIVEEVDEILVRSKILHDELSHALNEKINNNMLKLSMIAIVFMPLTFITSLFGMNFKNIPGAENPYGFVITCFLMSIVTITQVIFFKKKDWLD